MPQHFISQEQFLDQIKVWIQDPETDKKYQFLVKENYRNGGIWQSRISNSLAEYVQRRECFVNVQSSLHENVVFSVCARMCSAAYVIFIMRNSISGLDAYYHFRLNISCGVAVTVRSHQKKYQVTF